MPIHRYQMVYPYTGDVIETDSLKHGIRYCYQDFKRLSGMREGIFHMKDLDAGTEFKFRRNRRGQKKVRRVAQKDQIGGNPDPESKVEEEEKEVEEQKQSQSVAMSADQIIKLVDQRLYPILQQLEQHHQLSDALGAKFDRLSNRVRVDRERQKAPIKKMFERDERDQIRRESLRKILNSSSDEFTS